jgi:hypothetical protein
VCARSTTQQFLPRDIQILITVSCSRFIHGRHWQLRRFFLFIWQFDPCVCHLVLPPQEAECVGNAKIKEQSAVKHLSELWTVKMVLKWPCTLGIFKLINYFIDENSSKWCYSFRVLKRSHVLWTVSGDLLILEVHELKGIKENIMINYQEFYSANWHLLRVDSKWNIQDLMCLQLWYCDIDLPSKSEFYIFLVVQMRSVSATLNVLGRRSGNT